MAKIKIPLKILPVSFKDVTDFEFESQKGDIAIAQYLVNKKQFYPVKLTTKLNSYAGKIEFGLAPDDAMFTKEDIKSIDRWCAVKLGISDPVERKARVKSIIRKYRSVGGAPRPWFRPAIYSVFDDLENLFDNGAMSFYDLAVEMKERAQDNLETLHINYTGALSQSLTVENLNEEEYKRVMKGQIDTVVLDEYWSRYRKQEEVIPDDDGKTRDSRKAEWPPKH